MDLGGYPVTLADTAGLREVSDEVESEGIRRALAVAGSADLKLVVFDATARPVLDPEGSRFIDDRSIIVINKIDEDDQSDDKLIGDQFIRLSAITGHGIDNLINHLTIKISNDLSIDSPTMTRTRHRNALTECLACLRRATGATLPELFAEDVRLAARQLGRITGMISVDDVLDAVFRQFCIGK